jgi:hypothetical protein
LAYSQHGGSILYIESQKANNISLGNIESNQDQSQKFSKIGALKVTG